MMQTELALASWALSAFSIPVGDEDYAAHLLRGISWQGFVSRPAALLWKAMAELHAEGQPVCPETVAAHLGTDLAEIGDLARLWELIAIETLPPTPVVVEVIVPATHDAHRKRRLFKTVG